MTSAKTASPAHVKVQSRARRTRRARPKVLRLTAVYLPADEGGYTAEILEGTSVYTQGETIEEARENLADVLRLMLEEAPRQLGKRRRARPPGALTETLFVVLPA